MKKMTLNNVYEWPLMTRLLLLGLIFFISFYLGYRMALSNLFSKLSAAEQKETDIKQEIEFVIHKSKVIQSEISHLPVLRRELDKWNKELVNYQDLPQLLNQILKLGADNHLFFSLFTPGESVNVPLPPRPVEGVAPMQADVAAPPPDPNAVPAPTDQKMIVYKQVPIKVVVVGNYHEIADFISQLANLPWIVDVGNFTITSEDQSSVLGERLAKQAAAQHLLSAEMVLNIYNLPESK